MTEDEEIATLHPSITNADEFVAVDEDLTCRDGEERTDEEIVQQVKRKRINTETEDNDETEVDDEDDEESDGFVPGIEARKAMATLYRFVDCRP